jgi:DNA topoisomerase-3
MSKTLIIAEKPSVATDLARVLGKMSGMTKFENHKEYFENETHVISSAVGHLLELTMPTSADGKKLQWKFEHLPVLPAKFDLQPIEKSESRLKVLQRLLKRKDVTQVINACDAGREGELIFRYIIQASGVQKPMQRLWMQSMTAQSILDAFHHLREDREMLPLAEAAVCRSESDWLVGINGTRALTAFNSRNGGFLKTPVGRVQTPTLAVLVQREKEIQVFVPRTYWEVFGDFKIASGSYRGRWFDDAFKKEESNDEHARAERHWEQSRAEQIKARCEGKPGEIEETKKPAKQASPLLFDLTSLQREASNRFGFSARRTLQIAQALYEGHKVLTYPRTDSRHLPEDYLGTVKSVMKTIAGAAGQGDALPEDLPKFAAKALNANYVFPTKRVFDNAKVTDHFAIIPTGVIAKHLKPEEAKIFDMVARRFVAVFFPQAEFEVTTRITRIDADAFKTEGKVMKVPGWLEVYGKMASENDDAIVPAKPGEKALNTQIEITENQTKPPPRYTEATLLTMMETAGKLVDDEDLADAMSERGLGTPATRASIIEGLIYETYIARDGKELVATPKGIALIEQLKQIGVDGLTSPQMTGEWEYKLKQMEHGKLDRSTFMGQIRSYATEVVEKTRSHAQAVKTMDYPDLAAPCPICHAKVLRQTDNAFKCKNPECGWSMYKTLAGHQLTLDQAKQLLTTRFVGPISGFRNRFGKEFDAGLELNAENKVAFVFPNQRGDGHSSPAEDLEVLKDPANILCPCPVCEAKGRSASIYVTDTHFVCESIVRNDSPCKPKARLMRELCKYQIPREQAVKFFRDGKTDLIDKFISKKGRPFKSYLVRNLTGRTIMEFEFPPREPKAGGRGRKAAAGA